MWIDWFTAPGLTPLLWVVLGTLGMYGTTLVLARWSGVRSFAQMSTFDIAVTIAVGSMIATTVASKDPPLLQGMVALATLYGLQLLVSRLRGRFSGIAKATDNTPILLMGPGGIVKEENMRVARVTEDDLRTHLRKANVHDRRAIRAVVIEGTGNINVLHGSSDDTAVDEWILQDVRDHAQRPAFRN